MLDKGFHGNLSPLGHEISRESTERLPLTCVYVEIHKKKNCYVIPIVSAIFWLRMNWLRDRADQFLVSLL